jgi:hypothetical protein
MEKIIVRFRIYKIAPISSLGIAIGFFQPHFKSFCSHEKYYFSFPFFSGQKKTQDKILIFIVGDKVSFMYASLIKTHPQKGCYKCSS